MSADKDGNVDQIGGLVLDPSNELRFKGPFDDYVTVSLTIKNPTSKKIAFKIKTTAPKRYCVKPNSGVLESSQSMKVNVLLQPFNYDPAEKNKHKFMVQYLYLTDREMQMNVNDILNMWKDISTERLLDMKLKCVFEFTEAEQQRLQHLTPQSDQSMTTSTTNQSVGSKQLGNTSNISTVTSTLNKPQSQQQQQQNVSKAKTLNNDDDDSTVNGFESMSSISNTTSSAGTINRTTVNNATTSTPSTAVVGNVAREKNDNVLNELKLYKQENEVLKKEINRLKEEEVRLRKLALQNSSGNSAARANVEASSLSDLLNNRLVLVIIILIAIIVYLLLFR